MKSGSIKAIRAVAAPTGPRPVLARLLILALLAGFAGSGCARRSYDAYVPEPALARRALDEALQSWQRGEKLKTLVRADLVPVRPVDTAWTTGHKLRAYKIMGDTHGDSPRCFAVRLWLDDQPDEQLVRYYVLGINPLWVFRQDDYDMMAHWDCPTEPVDARQASKKPATLRN